LITNLSSGVLNGVATLTDVIITTESVAILIKPLLSISVKNVEKDDGGRYISLELCGNEKVYRLTNVYASNNGTERIDCFNSLSSKLMDLTETHIIGGNSNLLFKL
jgi:hypothetical protein